MAHCTGQSENQKTHKTWNTVCNGVPNKHKPNVITSGKCITVYLPLDSISI